MPSRPSSVGQTVLVLSVSEADVMIEAFNGIASVDHVTNLLDLLGILEICTEIGAVGPPGLGDSWILLSHRFEKASNPGLPARPQRDRPHSERP